MTWEHYTWLIQAKSTSMQAWRTANEANTANTLDMLALAIHESKAHDVAALIQTLTRELNDLRLGIQRCDFCGGVKESFEEWGFAGYLCPRCDADEVAELQKPSERRWMLENAIIRHTETIGER